MSIPWPEGRPESTVGNDSGAQLTQGFQVMVRQLQSLERVISTQTAMFERTANAAQRYQMGNQRQLSQNIINQVVATGGTPHGVRTTEVSGMGALSSMENLRAYGAQRLGQWIAGTPLYEAPPTQGGGTPAGTPSSTNQGGGGPGRGGGGGGSGGGGGGGASGGSGSPGGGSGGPGGGGPGGQPLGGLPGWLWGGQNAAQSTQAQTGTAVLRQVGARVAMSGGGLGGIASAMRQLPGIGLAMDAIQGGADFYLNQREAGRTYQSVEGGSNLGAQTERLHQAIYGLSMFGRMPEGAAAQAFGSVTAMGYNQAAVGQGQNMQNRQNALNFIYHNYTNTGMDVNQSLQVLQSASQSAVVNLTQLSTVLKNVSDTAGQAGANADTARQQFNSYFQAALAQGAGSGAATVAGGISSMQASMGKQFSGVNFSGELSQSHQYLVAGMSGLSPAQLQYAQRNNPKQYNQLMAGSNMQLLSQGGMMTPQMQSSLNQMISSAGGGKAMMSNPTLRDQVAQQFLNQWQLKGNINQDFWAQEISALTGVQMNPTQAFQWIVSQSAGINEASHNSSLGPPSGASVSANRTGSAPSGRYGLAQGTPASMGSVASRYVGPTGGTSWQQALQQANGAAAAPYLSAESKSGKRSPVLEALLQNTSQGDQVRVQTKSGARVMSVADAMKYYPNELAAGNVEFYNSSGQALGDTSGLTHGLTNASANVKAEQKQNAGSNLGVAASKFHVNTVAPAGGGTAGVFDLTPAAQQLLKLLPANNDQAAATSQVPAITSSSQASR